MDICRSSRHAGTHSTFAERPLISHLNQEEMTMDWNRVEGNWKQFKGAAKEKWGKLTDDDLDVIEGRREQLEGKLQQRYGFAKDQIRKDVDDWFRLAEVSCVRQNGKAPASLPGLFLSVLSEPTVEHRDDFSSEITPMMITTTRAICLARPSSGNRLIR